jgi:hypothetical protein
MRPTDGLHTTPEVDDNVLCYGLRRPKARPAMVVTLAFEGGETPVCWGYEKRFTAYAVIEYVHPILVQFRPQTHCLMKAIWFGKSMIITTNMVCCIVVRSSTVEERWLSHWGGTLTLFLALCA